MQDEAMRRLLTPLTDEEAANVKLVTRQEIAEAIARVDRALTHPGWHARVVPGRPPRY